MHSHVYCSFTHKSQDIVTTQVHIKRVNGKEHDIMEVLAKALMVITL